MPRAGHARSPSGRGPRSPPPPHGGRPPSVPARPPPRSGTAGACLRGRGRVPGRAPRGRPVVPLGGVRTAAGTGPGRPERRRAGHRTGAPTPAPAPAARRRPRESAVRPAGQRSTATRWRARLRGQPPRDVLGEFLARSSRLGEEVGGGEVQPL